MLLILHIKHKHNDERNNVTSASLFGIKDKSRRNKLRNKTKGNIMHQL